MAQDGTCCRHLRWSVTQKYPRGHGHRDRSRIHIGLFFILLPPNALQPRRVRRLLPVFVMVWGRKPTTDASSRTDELVMAMMSLGELSDRRGPSHSPHLVGALTRAVETAPHSRVGPFEPLIIILTIRNSNRLAAPHGKFGADKSTVRCRSVI